MLSSLLSPTPAAAPDGFIIAPHHPDRLRRPAARPGALERERRAQALTWNVFRTLDLVAPAFWLRRLHSRLTGEPSPTAPQVMWVSLWRSLPLPPIQRIDGARADVLADVVIETEHAVWALIVAADPDHAIDEDERAARVIDAGTWLAGARHLYFGVIEPDTDAESLGGVLRQRYARSRESVGLRSATRGPAKPSLSACGIVRWADLAAILQDCAEAPSLSAIEATLARNAVAWLGQAGIRPAQLR